MNVVQTGVVFVDQNNYISSLKPLELSIETVSQKDEELTIEGKSKLRSISGQLLSITSQTRPDGSFDNCRLSNYGKNLMLKNLLEANKAVKKLQSSTLRLVYPDLRNPEYRKVIVYGDATHASLPSGASQGALAESADAGHFVALMTKEIFGLKTAPRVFCYTDNKSPEEHIKSLNVTQDIRLRVDIERWGN